MTNKQNVQFALIRYYKKWQSCLNLLTKAYRNPPSHQLWHHPALILTKRRMKMKTLNWTIVTATLRKITTNHKHGKRKSQTPLNPFLFPNLISHTCNYKHRTTSKHRFNNNPSPLLLTQQTLWKWHFVLLLSGAFHPLFPNLHSLAGMVQMHAHLSLCCCPNFILLTIPLWH